MSKQPKDIGPILKKILNKIESSNPADRHDGFTALQHDAEFLHGRIPRELVPRFLQAFLDETNEELRSVALAALLTVSMMPSVDVPAPPPVAASVKAPKSKSDHAASSPKKHLGDWLVEPFLQMSAVISVYDAEKYRRDEPAEVYLGRRLAYDRNPFTQFMHFSAAVPRAHLVLPSQSFKAVCVIGRPGLFGEEWFLPLIRYPLIPSGGDNGSSEALRFGFAVHHRSTEIPHNQIDRSYHYLTERKGDESIESWHTEDDGRRRRDYGLVQRYTVDIGGQPTVIVIVAGASSLGTLGAARWASYLLFPDPDDPSSETTVIPTPDGKKALNRLEALVEVTADATQGAWESPNVDLRKLTVDAESWSPADRRWLPTAPDEITLSYRDNKPFRVLFDRRPHAFGNPSKMLVLTVALAESARQGRTEMSLDELRRDKAAWEPLPSDEIVSFEYAADQLRTLRNRHLGTALSIDGDLVSVRCKIRRIDEP